MNLTLLRAIKTVKDIEMASSSWLASICCLFWISCQAGLNQQVGLGCAQHHLTLPNHLLLYLLHFSTLVYLLLHLVHFSTLFNLFLQLCTALFHTFVPSAHCRELDAQCTLYIAKRRFQIEVQVEFPNHQILHLLHFSTLLHNTFVPCAHCTMLDAKQTLCFCISPQFTD